MFDIYVCSCGISEKSCGGEKWVFFACMRLFTMCKIFEFCMTGLNIFVNLYEKVLAGLALCQYNELITVEILYIYCKCCMSTDSQVSNGRATAYGEST